MFVDALVVVFFCLSLTTITSPPPPLLFLFGQPSQKKEISKKMREPKKRDTIFIAFFPALGSRRLCFSLPLSLSADDPFLSLSLSPSHLFEEYTRCARETDRPRAPKRSTSPRKKTTRKLERARVEQTRKNCFFYPPLFLNENTREL